MSRPFIPRDKPESWVVFFSALLVALLVFGPLVFLAEGWLYRVGSVGFIACWVVAASMWVVYRIGTGTGRHNKLEPRPWKDQVW